MVPLPPAKPTPTNAPAPEQGSTRARRRAPTSRRRTAATSRTRTGTAMRVRVPGPSGEVREDPHGCGDEARPEVVAGGGRRGPAQAQRRDSGSDNARPIYVITTPRCHNQNPVDFRAGADPADGARAGPGRGGLRNSSSAQRDPGAGARMGRDRLAQCEPSATKSTPPRAVRAQRDEIRPSSIRASPPRTMRPEVTSPIRLPQGRGSGAASRSAPGQHPSPGRRRGASSPAPRSAPGQHRHPASSRAITPRDSTTPASTRPRLSP